MNGASPHGSLLDRLLIDESEPIPVRDAIARDLRNLLNARRSWHAFPQADAAPGGTILDYGLPDFTGGAFDAREQRDALRSEIMAAIAAFEPRLTRVRVTLGRGVDDGRFMLRLVVEAMLATQGDPRPVAFQAEVDIATTDLWVRNIDE